MRALRHPLLWIVLLAALLRWQAGGALRSSDDLDYAQGARDFIQGRYKPDSFHQLRLGMILPVGLGFLVFGVHPAVSILWPLAASLGSIALLYLLAAKRSTKSVAVLAALFLAVSTQHVISGAELFPDAPLAFWVLLGLYFYWKEREAEGRTPGYVLAGLCFYAGLATRIETLKLLPIFAAIEAWFVRRRGWDRNWARRTCVTCWCCARAARMAC